MASQIRDWYDAIVFSINTLKLFISVVMWLDDAVCFDDFEINFLASFTVVNFCTHWFLLHVYF